jgi:hypothetical protein
MVQLFANKRCIFTRQIFLNRGQSAVYARPVELLADGEAGHAERFGFAGRRVHQHGQGNKKFAARSCWYEQIIYSMHCLKLMEFHICNPGLVSLVFYCMKL